MSRFVLALLPLLLARFEPAQAQEAPPPVLPVLTGATAFGDWTTDRPGTQRRIGVGDLPAPYATKSASNGPRGAPLPASPKLRVPPGFAVSLWASGLDGPRELKVAPNGDVFVAESATGAIVVVPAARDGSAAEPAKLYASDLDGVFGMAFYPARDPRWLYVGTSSAVLRFPYRSGDVRAASRPETVVDLGISEGGHSTRDLAFSGDGSRMYVSVGSQSNVAEGMPPLAEALLNRLPKGASWAEEEGRADVLVFDPEGKGRRAFATGLRNCVGLATQPSSDALFCSTNERDGLGDNLPPDYVTRVQDNGFYGWPWYYIGNHEDPRHKGERPDLAGAVLVPDVLIQPHSAPLGMTFYDAAPDAAAAFPAADRGSAFVALHGSWNRAKRTGYKVVRLPVENGNLSGTYEDFLIGFVNPDGSVWGRPVGVAVARDGALLVSEDQNGTIWRITPAERED